MLLRFLTRFISKDVCYYKIKPMLNECDRLMVFAAQMVRYDTILDRVLRACIESGTQYQIVGLALQSLPTWAAMLAVKHNRADVLTMFNVPLSEELRIAALASGHMRMHIYTRSWVPLDPDKIRLAAIKGGNLDVCKDLAQTCTFLERDIPYVALYGHMELFRWMCQALHPYNLQVGLCFIRAVEGQQREFLTMIVGMYTPPRILPARAYMHGTEYAIFVRGLIQEPLMTNAVYYASRHSVEACSHAHDAGGLLFPACHESAAEYDRVDVGRWLIAHDVVPNHTAISIARDKPGYLKLLQAHGYICEG